MIEQGGEADAVVLLKHGTLVVETKTEGEAPRKIATVERGGILAKWDCLGTITIPHQSASRKGLLNFYFLTAPL